MSRSARALDHEPRVLLLTAYRYASTARLAFGFFQAGLTVDVLCPKGHPIELLKIRRRIYHARSFSGISCIRDAIERSNPDFIVPADDYTAAKLHQLYALTGANDTDSCRLRNLIERSIGDPNNYSTFYARDKIATLARGFGVHSPVVTIVPDKRQLSAELARIGFPAVLKTDGSSGGRGVAVLKDQTDAERLFRKLAYPSVGRALKRVIVDSDNTLLLPSLRRDPARRSVQRFISGRHANAAVACWEGEVLALVTVEVLVSSSATGPATVVRVIDHKGISAAVERMIDLLQLSGLCGFDFIVDAGDAAHLIDFNPRATPTCHLVSAGGAQPLAWLAAKWKGIPIKSTTQSPHHNPIVMFPHGFTLVPESPYWQFANSDVPADSPEFVKIGLAFQRHQSRPIVKASDAIVKCLAFSQSLISTLLHNGVRNVLDLKQQS